MVPTLSHQKNLTRTRQNLRQNTTPPQATANGTPIQPRTKSTPPPSLAAQGSPTAVQFWANPKVQEPPAESPKFRPSKRTAPSREMMMMSERKRGRRKRETEEKRALDNEKRY